MRSIPRQCPRPQQYLVTVALGGWSELRYQHLWLTPHQRSGIEAIDAIHVQINADAHRDAATRHAERVTAARIAEALGSHRGLDVRVDLTAGMGTVLLTPLGGVPGLLATLAIESTDVLVEVA